MLQGPGEGAGIVDIGDGLAVVLKQRAIIILLEPYEGQLQALVELFAIFSVWGAADCFTGFAKIWRTDGCTNTLFVSRSCGGISGYGNCIGIPTVGGEIAFEPCYQGNPLVNAMCVGLIRHDEIQKAKQKASEIAFFT